jgi:hypothetical protein
MTYLIWCCYTCSAINKRTIGETTLWRVMIKTSTLTTMTNVPPPVYCT